MTDRGRGRGRSARIAMSSRNSASPTRGTISSACICTIRARAGCLMPGCSRLKMPRPAKCLNWIPIAASVRERFAAVNENRLAQLDQSLNRTAVDTLRLNTDEPFAQTLQRFLKSAGDGGVADEKQHSTFNIQHSTPKNRAVCLIIRWKLNVECSMFLGYFISSHRLSVARPDKRFRRQMRCQHLLPPYGELPPTFWEQHGTVLMLAGLGIIALAAFGLWLIFRPRPKLIIPPEVQARQALEMLRRTTGRRGGFEPRLASLAKLFHRGVSTGSRRIDHHGILPRNFRQRRNRRGTIESDV